MSGYLYRGSPELERINASIMAARTPGTLGPKRCKPRHGTTTGYKRHLAEGTEPCEACREAQREYKRRWDQDHDRRKVG